MKSVICFALLATLAQMQLASAAPGVKIIQPANEYGYGTWTVTGAKAEKLMDAFVGSSASAKMDNIEYSYSVKKLECQGVISNVEGTDKTKLNFDCSALDLNRKSDKVELKNKQAFADALLAAHVAPDHDMGGKWALWTKSVSCKAQVSATVPGGQDVSCRITGMTNLK